MPARAQAHKHRAGAISAPARCDRARAALALICVTYAVIAIAYAVAIPFSRAPDESAHMPYIRYLAHKGRLPVFRAGEGSYEYHQPPLYYVAALPAYFVGRAAGDDRAYLAVRLFGIAFGIGVIALTYLLARDFLPAQPWLAVGSAGFAAFLPMHIALSAAVTNDVAAEVPFAAALWQLVLAARQGWRWRRTAIIGILCGLAVLAKSSAIVLLAAAWFALALQARSEDASQLALKAAGLTAAALAVCGWWLARNWALYGDPLAWQAFLQAFANNPHPGDLIGPRLSVFNYILWVTGWTFASFWGVFGTWARGVTPVFMPLWVYLILAAVTGIALAGLGRQIAEAGTWEPWRRRAAWALAAAALLVAASFVRFNLSFFQAQGRYLFPALPVIAIGFVSGWGRMCPTRWRNWSYAVLWLAILVLGASALPVWVLPGI